MNRHIRLYRIILLWMLCFAFVDTMAQKQDNTIIDSIEKKLKHYLPSCKTPCAGDSIKVTLLLDLAWQYNFNKTDTVLALSNVALELAGKINYIEGIAQAYHMIGNFYKGQGDLPNALKFLFGELKTLDQWSNTNKKSKLILSKKAACFNSIANVYKGQGDNAKALNYFNDALSINEKYNNLEAIAINNKNIGDIYVSWGSFPKALNCYYKALRIAEQLNKENIAAATLGSIGLIYRRQNNFDKAIELYNKALVINTRLNEKRGIGINLGQLGASYKEKGDYEKALRCYNSALEAFTSVKFKVGIASIYNNIGEIFLVQAQSNEKKERPDSSVTNNLRALGYFRNAFTIQQALGRNSPMAVYIGNIGLANIALKRSEEGEKYLLQSLGLFDTLMDFDGSKWITEELSNFYLANGKHENALVYYKKSTISKDSLFNEKKIQELTSQRLNYENEEREVATKAAYELQTKMMEAERRRAVDSADKRRLIAEAEADKKRILAETETQNAISETKNRLIVSESKMKVSIAHADNKRNIAEADARQQKSTRNYILVVASLFILSSILVFILYKRKRDADQKQKETALSLQVSETEMKALRSQMNPHFIFNALQSIQTFLMSHQPDDANTYLLKFSKLMRLVLENSQDSEVALKDDMQALELYMQLESIRLPHPFTYQFHIDENVDVEETTIPPLILQPFVENAIWHGLQYKPAPGHIDIYISKRGNTLYGAVEDNGVGRDKAKMIGQPVLMKKESLGMKLTEERLKILNELKNIKADFQVIDLFTNDNKPAGTKVELFLPLVE